MKLSGSFTRGYRDRLVMIPVSSSTTNEVHFLEHSVLHPSFPLSLLRLSLAMMNI